MCFTQSALEGWKLNSCKFKRAEFTHSSLSHPCHSIVRNGISLQESSAIFSLKGKISSREPDSHMPSSDVVSAGWDQASSINRTVWLWNKVLLSVGDAPVKASPWRSEITLWFKSICPKIFRTCSCRATPVMHQSWQSVSSSVSCPNKHHSLCCPTPGRHHPALQMPPVRDQNNRDVISF